MKKIPLERKPKSKAVDEYAKAVEKGMKSWNFALKAPKGRADDDVKKHVVLMRLFEVWRKQPYLRLGQLIQNMQQDIYYTEDFDLVTRLEEHYKPKDSVES